MVYLCSGEGFRSRGEVVSVSPKVNQDHVKLFYN